MKYLLSIIIPIFNVEKYLADCLNSLLPFKTSNIEIICINDGSMDKSLSILQDFSNHLEIKIINQENKGLSASRNIGIKEALGEYVAFIDSDDYISAKGLIELTNLAIKCHVDIAIGDYWEFSDGDFNSKLITKSITMELNKICSGKDFFREYYKQLSSVVWRNIYRRNFLLDNEIMFHEGVYFEDMEYTPLVFYKATRIIYSNIPFYYYRKRNNSITTSKYSEKKVRDSIEVWKKLDNETNQIKDPAISSIFRQIGFHGFLIQYSGLDKPLSIELLQELRYLSDNPMKTMKYSLFSLLFRYLPDSMFFKLLKLLI